MKLKSMESDSGFAAEGKAVQCILPIWTRGCWSANGIVGGGFPLACGAALTAKYKKTDHVSVCFFGDGANNHGNIP